MKSKLLIPVLLILVSLVNGCTGSKNLQIFYPSGSDAQVVLAAKEVRRYLYLRTGQLATVGEFNGETPPTKLIWVMAKGQNAPQGMLPEEIIISINKLENDGYFIKSGDRTVIAGSSPVAALYAAYAFAEKLGVRFYLHGDVIPDGKVRMPEFEETGTPKFKTRGIQPFHDFPEGPDWWTLEDYKAYFSQIAKMKMNFFGLHTYPEGGVGPEPLVWIGPQEEINPDGTVKSAYPARHFTTTNGTWAYTSKLTSDYSHQLGLLFEDDSYGTDYIIGMKSWPSGDHKEIDLFNTTGDFFGNAFGFAKKLGISICVGTETPLIVPKKVKEKFPELKTVDYYKGMFQWITKNYPIDYYWFWTPEDWTWSGNTPEHLQKTVDDLKAAQDAVDALGNPFQLATCGWVLGPVQDRAMFDQFLPKSWPMSCINQQVGFTPVDPGFSRVSGRSLWAIPWMEDDPALTSMQLWAGRMRADGADALAYGCDGLIGIHWRTQPLQTNIGALAEAGWHKGTGTTSTVPLRQLMTPAQADSNFMRTTRDLPVDDFYADWALAQFGKEVADSMSKLMISVDGQEVSINKGGGKKTRLPRQGDWTGPGGVIVDTLPWEQRAADYAFVDRIESWQKLVKGAGQQERFDYWLNFFRYHRAFGKFASALGQTEKLLQKLEKQGAPDPSGYLDTFVAQRIQLMTAIREALGYLLAYASTPGDLGTIANWQQHLMVYNVQGQADRIEKLTGRKLPPEAMPSRELLDIKKLLVPTVRTQVVRGENMPVRLILYGIDPAEAIVKFRPLGAKTYQQLEFRNVGRGVYRAEIPSGSLTDDFEYHISVKEKTGKIYLWPATAPDRDQTVVIL